VKEQLLLDVISKQVEEKKIIRSSQPGLNKGKSCLTNLIAFYNGMTRWRDKGRAVVYLSGRSLAEVISHNTLIRKFRNCVLASGQ